MIVKIPAKFQPLFKPNRYKVYYGGRGAAKSWNIARALLILGAQKPLRILCTREVQKSIRDSVHKLLKDQIDQLGLSANYQVFNTEIKGANGTEFIFEGLKHDPAKIKSYEGVDICWVEEAEKVTDDSWDILIPTIRKPGSEIWVSFNTGFKFDPTYQRFVINPPPDAIVCKVTWRDNPFLSNELLAEKDYLEKSSFEKYLHIWEGELRTLAEGAIFGEQITKAKQDKRILNIPIESSCEVHTFWDLGKNDHTSIWFMQHVAMEYRFIDYYENRLKDIEHYARVIKDKKYLYGTHYMPHDVGVQLLGMEKTRKQQFEAGGVRPIEVVARIPEKMEGIEAARQIFGKCWFDKTRCERGLEALSNYRFIFDEDKDSYRLKPHHDWASNGADAYMQFAQGYNPENSEDMEFDIPSGVGL